MKSIVVYSLSLLFLSTIWLGCAEESIPATTEGLNQEYYPLAIGKTWIYTTDSIVFNGQLNSIDTLSGYIKESINESNIGVEGDEVYTIERSFKRLESDPWVNTGTYSASILELKAIRTEDNLRFVKMVFPLSANVRWDGNQFIPEDILINIGGEQLEVYKAWDYKVNSVDSEITVGDVTYSQVADITGADDENGIELRKSREVYAPNVGLVYREMMILDTQNSNTVIPFVERADKGFILIQRLIETF